MAEDSAAMRIRILVRRGTAFLDSNNKKQAYVLAKSILAEMTMDPIHSASLEVDLIKQGINQGSFLQNRNQEYGCYKLIL